MVRASGYQQRTDVQGDRARPTLTDTNVQLSKVDFYTAQSLEKPLCVPHHLWFSIFTHLDTSVNLLAGSSWGLFTPPVEKNSSSATSQVTHRSTVIIALFLLPREVMLKDKYIKALQLDVDGTTTENG